MDGPVPPVRAAAYTVSTCDESSLRSAITFASPGDTVNFSCSGVITLNSPIMLSKSLTIDGSGQSVTISGGDGVQVIVVSSGVAVTLNDLTIADGTALYVSGAGIDNNGTLSVTNSTLINNGGGQKGGGIFNAGTLSVTNSTFSGNSAGVGGGIFNAGTLSVTNSTFSGNSAGAGAGIASQGTATLANTIVAYSPRGDCFGIFGNGGSGNFADDATCGSFAQVSRASLSLGPLANNGGSTQTFALGAGSVAIDSTSANCPSTDQVGSPRPDAGESTCDSGAYEFQDPIDADLGLANVPADINVNATSPAGAVVTYTPPTAVDEAGDSPAATVSCTPASGSTFAIGTTTVTCTATDSDDTNGPVSASFMVTVNDTDLALANVPANITTNATSLSGAVVTYPAPTAVDEAGDSTTASVSCDHASGSTFPIGPTTVTCTASDSDDTNGPVSASFTVTITYVWSGFSQPIYDPAAGSTTMRVFKAGSTIPVKFQLETASSGVVEAVSLPTFSVSPLQPCSAGAVDATAVYTATADTSTTYRWDSTAQQYIYNYKTSPSYSGFCQFIQATLDDGTTHGVYVGYR
jgi:hypothetical protein